MKLRKIYEQGEIKNQDLYDRLQVLDSRVFPNCGNEFKSNRDWWVVVNEYGRICAFCGCLYSGGVCIFVRAWVHEPYRGNGLQRKMIKARINAAILNGCYTAITYTTHDNSHSANNLYRMGFTMYRPEYFYSGKEMIYFRKSL